MVNLVKFGFFRVDYLEELSKDEKQWIDTISEKCFNQKGALYSFIAIFYYTNSI